MKKIFFIMSTNDFSGAEAVNFSIIDALKDKYDFYWVSRRGKINKFLEERDIKWIEIHNLNIQEIRRIVKYNEPDIIHATDFKASVICALAHLNVYLIEHLHNNSPWLKRFSINSIVFLYAGLRANKILTVSESIEKEYIFSKFIKNKIQCVGNPINRDFILKQVSDKDFEKKYDICCVARITEQKNPKKFINIIFKIKKEIPNIKCIWVGKGELYEECKTLVSELNLNNNIEFVGFKKNPYKYMASSKLFMLTSDWEGFGLVAFEALALGVPCLVSNVGGLPDIVDDKCGRLCETVDDYVTMAVHLLTNSNLYSKFSENSIIKSKKIDNWNDYMKVLCKIYS